MIITLIAHQLVISASAKIHANFSLISADLSSIDSADIYTFLQVIVISGCCQLATMPSTHKCPGCTRDFDTSRALSVHKQSCRKLVNAASDVLKKRRRNIEVQQAAKVQHQEEEREAQRRREEIRESTTEAEEDVPAVSIVFHFCLIFV